MHEPGDTDAFLHTLSRAITKSLHAEWSDALDLWEQVVADNPLIGWFWVQLADAAYHTQEYRRAIAAYQRALPLGLVGYWQPMDLGKGFPFDVAYRIACCYALIGEQEEALAWLADAMKRGYRTLSYAQNDPDLRTLHDDVRFRELVGLMDIGTLTRDEGWRADLDLLARQVKRKGYAPFRFVTEAEFDAAISTLQEAIPTFDDVRIFVEFQKLLRLLGDGHSNVSPPDETVELNYTLPLQLYWFEEGLFIIAAAPQYAELVGAEVCKFDGRSISALVEGLEPTISRDNDQWLKQMVPYRLRQLPILHALGLIDHLRDVNLSLRLRDGTSREASLTADLEQPHSALWNAFQVPASWRWLPATLETPLPHYLQHSGVTYWFEQLPDSRTVYVQFNRVRDDSAESLADFTARLFAHIESTGIERLIIDLRWNNGGNTFLMLPLLYRLIGSPLNRRGALYVIIGRRTFSAAQNAATMIEQHTNAIFVGEPTGSSPNSIGEESPIQLPYSKIWLNVSDLFWQTSWPTDSRTWIAPRIWTPPTFAAYLENRDLALEAILSNNAHLPNL
ncbi:MAG TPA: hypothetical protein VHV31_02225 [Nitrolancea sp.]|jgi:tetratricopeptide (TPR) repeat protein|nr:hypothetical protein [Nitrolancea sp.]